MEEQYLPPTPPAKKWTVKETLTVVFLVLFPIVGLILMWLIANWSKKVKIIITLVIVLLPLIVIGGIILSIALVGLEKAEEKAHNARRQADLRQIAIAQEMYYSEYGAYYTSLNYPPEIGNYLTPTPRDPLTEAPYGWIDNTRDNQKFCVYADLERDGFYIASHAGGGESKEKPLTLSDCEKIPLTPFLPKY